MHVHLTGKITANDPQLDTAITVMRVLNLGVSTFLITGSAGAAADPKDPTAPRNGGVALFNLSDTGAASLLDSYHFQAGATLLQTAEFATFGLPDPGLSVVLGTGHIQPQAFTVTSGGSLAPTPLPPSLEGLNGTGPVVGAQDTAQVAAQALNGEILLFSAQSPDTPLTTDLPTTTSALSFGPITSAGQSLLGISATTDTITFWRPSEPNVTLGIEDGLGISKPIDIETIHAYDKIFALVASSESGSLSVLEVDPAGALQTLDHIIDTRSTRFANVQDIAVAQAQDRVFVFAAGGDNGISMFNLLPDGRLVHLDSVAEGLLGGLSGIHSLSVYVTTNSIEVYAATEDSLGLTHLSVPLGTMGHLLSGTFEQIGTSRADILVAGPTGARLTGGEDRDVFVLQHDGGNVHVTDFNPAEDTLDLSDFAMLRDPGQLSISETETGAQISYRDEVITLDSFDGEPLNPDALFANAFDWPDRIAYFPSGTVAGVSDSSEETPDTDPPSNAGLSWLEITLTPSQPNPALEGANLFFHSNDGTMHEISLDQTGRFDLSDLSGETGQLVIGRPYSETDPAIGVSDALDILRIAVGLEPMSGPPTLDDLAAADFDGNGRVSVADALDVLRFAIGVGPAPEWRFVDPDSNIAQAVETGTPLQNGIGADFSAGVPETLDVIAILPGSINGWS